MSTLDELVYYCKEANSFGALMLTGKWGCGKTYLIDKELSKELGEDYIIIRVSLFGESSVDSINKKVQKAYFHNVMLHMGGVVQGAAQYIPGISEENVSKLAERTGNITDTIAEKFNSSKMGGFARFVTEIAKMVPGADKILSISPSDYFSVERTIADKKVILVFDDLERTNLNEIDVLGCINEYCENKQIKTIIVANEEKILDKRLHADTHDVEKKNRTEDSDTYHTSGCKIRYSEIKEKIITRTVKHIANYEKIISQITDEFISDIPLYKEFLKEHRTDLINVYHSGNSHNIRSIKCAVQDFQRLFIELKKKGIDEELGNYFQTFIAFVLEFKEGKISKSEHYGYLLCDHKIEEEYPGFYDNRYMLQSVKRWIIDGEWDSDGIACEINKMINAKKDIEPKDVVRNSDLIRLDEQTIKTGLPEVISLAYAGELSVDEYIILLSNLIWARRISYKLPAEVDMEKINKGVDKCLETLRESDELDTNIRSMMHPDNLQLLTDKECDIYQKICDFRDNDVQMFAINKRKYLKAIRSENVYDLYDCENKRFNVFDKEIAHEMIKRYKELPNAKRQLFSGIFRKMWGNKNGSQDLLKVESILGFKELRDMLRVNRTKEQAENYELRAALSEMFIQDVTKIIDSMEATMEK